jgi:hypothetical protein
MDAVGLILSGSRDMIFTKEFLLDKLWSGDYVEKTLDGHSRWSVDYSMIFEHEGRFYRSDYSQGATESQDESPYEYDPNELECPEMVEIEKIIKVWEKA